MKPCQKIETSQAILEGFFVQISDLENMGDQKQLKTIKNTALEFLKSVSDNDKNKQQIQSQIEKYEFAPPSQSVDFSFTAGVEVPNEKIARDGNCLFRAIAHGLIDRAEGSGDFIRHLKTKSRNLASLVEGGRKNSNKLVLALRKIACDFNEEHRPYIAEGNSQLYFDKMRKAAWGGSAEIAALSEVLGLEIAVKSHRDETQNKPKKAAIVLVYSNHHFDLCKRINRAFSQNIEIPCLSNSSVE